MFNEQKRIEVEPRDLPRRVAVALLTLTIQELRQLIEEIDAEIARRKMTYLMNLCRHSKTYS